MLQNKVFNGVKGANMGFIPYIEELNENTTLLIFSALFSLLIVISIDYFIDYIKHFEVKNK